MIHTPPLAVHEKSAIQRCQSPADSGAGIWVPSGGVTYTIGGGPEGYSEFQGFGSGTEKGGEGGKGGVSALPCTIASAGI